MSFSERFVSSRARARQSAVLCLIAAVVAIELAHIIALQASTFHTIPWADEWDTFFLASRAEKSPGTGLEFLLFPHNEHRIAIPRLIMLLDLITARGTGVINLAMLIMLPALSTLAFWFALRRRVEWPLLLTACLACLLFSGGQMSNFVWGFQTSVGALYLFSLLAFLCLAKAIEGAERRPYGAACFFAVCACLCQSGGFLVFPVLILIGAWHRRRAGHLGPLLAAIIAALIGFFYLWEPRCAPSPSGALISIWEQTLFVLSFLGSPFAAIASLLVVPAGVIAVALSVFLFVRYMRIVAPRVDQTLAVALCLFILAIASAAALSRIGLGIAGATESRFVTPAVFLWVGLLVGFWPSLTAGSAALCAVPVVIYSLLSHLWLPYNYYPLWDLKANAEITYVAGVKDESRLIPYPHGEEPSTVRSCFPPRLERILTTRPFMIRHGLGPFSSAVSQAVGRRLSEVYEVAPAPCRGHLDGDLEPVPGKEGYRLHGWALSDGGKAPRAMLLVQRDIVVGIGRFLEDRPDVMASNNGATESKVGFIGVVRDLSDPVRAYVATRGTACPIAGEVKPQAAN